MNNIKGIDRRSLFRFRLFYILYQYITPLIQLYLQENFGTVSQKSNLPIVGSLTPHSNPSLLVPAEDIISKLSYTHIEQLLKVSEPLKRTFYEIECIKGTWSVQEKSN